REGRAVAEYGLAVDDGSQRERAIASRRIHRDSEPDQVDADVAGGVDRLIERSATVVHADDDLGRDALTDSGPISGRGRRRLAKTCNEHEVVATLARRIGSGDV